MNHPTMNCYIQAVSALSPLPSLAENPLSSPLPVPLQTEGISSRRYRAAEPDYSGVIDGKLIRRMSRIVKMGVAAAYRCLQAAGNPMPGAIVTGTAYGCLEDTGIFLSRLIEQKEEMLSPTAFIQSTHNTVGAQIALMLQCTHYNNTFVHGGLSFESALLDALMLLEEGTADSVLTGAIDEITNTSYTILERLGLYRHTAAGEGAAFFLLTAGKKLPAPSQPGNAAGPAAPLARLEALHTFRAGPDISHIGSEIRQFLLDQTISMDEIDLVMTGENENTSTKILYAQLEQTVFQNKTIHHFKQFCGEYPTASSFALYLSCEILRSSGVKRILICNSYLDEDFSLMLLSKELYAEG